MLTLLVFLSKFLSFIFIVCCLFKTVSEDVTSVTAALVGQFNQSQSRSSSLRSLLGRRVNQSLTLRTGRRRSGNLLHVTITQEQLSERTEQLYEK